MSPKKYRFVRKLYGRGRTPATRQGRLILAVYILLVVGRTIVYQHMAQQDYQTYSGTSLESNAGGNLLIGLAPILILTCILLAICYKTGEEPKRQRGKKK